MSLTQEPHIEEQYPYSTISPYIHYSYMLIPDTQFSVFYLNHVPQYPELPFTSSINPMHSIVLNTSNNLGLAYSQPDSNFVFHLPKTLESPEPTSRKSILTLHNTTELRPLLQLISEYNFSVSPYHNDYVPLYLFIHPHHLLDIPVLPHDTPLYCLKHPTPEGYLELFIVLDPLTPKTNIVPENTLVLQSRNPQ